MTESRPSLKIGSRKSDLARLQAHEVAKALRTADPSLQIEFFFSESLGDKNLVDPLWKMPGKGVFTEDLTNDLTEGRVDLVVHSWKDLPVEEKAQTEIVATLPRADVRDLLLFKKSSVAKCSNSALRIFSSSPRREYNLIPFLSAHLPGGKALLSFESVRGNIPTRLRKLLETTEVDGLIVAKAALDRLLATTADEFSEARDQIRKALADCVFMVLPLSANPAAAAQGALAVEIRRDREDLRDLLAKIHHAETFFEAKEERRVLKSHGGGCHQKIGATMLRRLEGDLFFLRGLTEAGLVLDEKRLQGTTRGSGDAEVLRSDSFFERRALPPPDFNQLSAVFVAHIAAWPAGTKFDGVIWTAGLSTWKRLAALGAWVSGSAEGLGEREDPRLTQLAPELKWATLSHAQSGGASRGTLLPTYELIWKKDAKMPEGAALHWTSAFLFDEVTAHWPQLLQREHSCGPGKTWDRLRDRISGLRVRWPLKETT